MLSQAMIERTLSSPSVDAERKEKEETLRLRAEKVYEQANAPRYRESWEVYPFNSGYFMCVKLKGVGAEKLRVHLLDRYGVGLIATSATDLRIAFSCLEIDQVEPLFETIHKAAQELV
jgi:aspartate/methionine/tyrosine aminotransferase